MYDDRARAEGTQIDGPAVITTRATTYRSNPAGPTAPWRRAVPGSCAGRRRTTLRKAVRTTSHTMHKTMQATMPTAAHTTEQMETEFSMSHESNAEERALLDKFLADNTLFLGPDPEIMRNHSVPPRSPQEDAVLRARLDPHQSTMCAA